VPFIEPTEPYAIPPQLADVDVAGETSEVDADGRYGTLRGVKVTGELDLRGCDDLELIDCVLDGVSFAGTGVELDLTRCSLHACDLSGVRVRSVRKSSMNECRLAGSDFSEGQLEHVRIVGGTMRYANLRMAQCTRVAFDGVAMSEVDFHGGSLRHVNFDQSSLEKVNIDGCSLKNVDLRGASTLGFTVLRSLSGALISEQQVMELAWLFAMASGVDIETSDTLPD